MVWLKWQPELSLTKHYFKNKSFSINFYKNDFPFFNIIKTVKFSFELNSIVCTALI